MHSLGFEPRHANIVELESTPLDRSGTRAYSTEQFLSFKFVRQTNSEFNFTIITFQGKNSTVLVNRQQEPSFRSRVGTLCTGLSIE